MTSSVSLEPGICNGFRVGVIIAFQRSSPARYRLEVWELPPAEQKPACGVSWRFVDAAHEMETSISYSYCYYLGSSA